MGYPETIQENYMSHQKENLTHSAPLKLSRIVGLTPKCLNSGTIGLKKRKTALFADK